MDASSVNSHADELLCRQSTDEASILQHSSNLPDLNSLGKRFFMHRIRLRRTALLLVILVLCGCAGKSDSDKTPQNSTKTASKSGPHPGPESWEIDASSEDKITFYVKGMSKRLKLT